jgi:hypothetical protein
MPDRHDAERARSCPQTSGQHDSTATVGSLMNLQAYGRVRRMHRQALMRHRRQRCLALGPCMRLQFEDALTIRYQIQEILYAERRDDAKGMQHEIDTYAHLLPDGSNWKATLQVELPDANERKRELPQLNDAVHRVYVDVHRQPRVFALANEDLPDRHRSRPSAEHFLRFQLPESMRAAVLAGAPATLGCTHDQYEFRRSVPAGLLGSLCRDLVASTPTLDLFEEGVAHSR